MKTRAVYALAALVASPTSLQTQAKANTATHAEPASTVHVVTANSAAAASSPDGLPAELREFLPSAKLSGRAKFTFFGLSIYNASLWVAPGFPAGSYEKGSFALELGYLRNFTGEAIAKRSISEMRRQTPISDADEARWERAMRDVFPDVKLGDRITGVNRPGVGAAFLVNGKPRGEVRDPVFARLFFGIWLSGASSEPGLRAKLLALSEPQ